MQRTVRTSVLVHVITSQTAITQGSNRVHTPEPLPCDKVDVLNGL